MRGFYLDEVKKLVFVGDKMGESLKWRQNASYFKGLNEFVAHCVNQLLSLIFLK